MGKDRIVQDRIERAGLVIEKSEITIEFTSVSHKSKDNPGIRMGGYRVRKVKSNGHVVYSDRKSNDCDYEVMDDPIRNMELFVLGQVPQKGIYRRKSRNNTGNMVCLFQEIRRKLFGK